MRLSDNNRLMNLDDLNTPFYRHTIRQMEALLRTDPCLYLHPSKRWEYPWALQRADLPTGSRVLDAGCGASVFPLFLGEQDLRVTAIDPDLPEGLTVPASMSLRYVRGRLQQLPFASEHFDGVFCISVIEHLPLAEMTVALKELARVLKTGGRLLLTTDYAQNADEKMWYEGPGDRFAVDWNVFDRQRLQTLLNAIASCGLMLEGALDLEADWPTLRERMRRFHGYPYTSVGLALRKQHDLQ
jgi:SAM-dependent methyltransferase